MGSALCSVWLVSWVVENMDWQTALGGQDQADPWEARASQARPHPLSNIGAVGKFTQLYRKQLQARRVKELAEDHPAGEMSELVLRLENQCPFC